MTVNTSGDKTRQFKKALVRAAETAIRPLELPGHGLIVRYGAPSKTQMKSSDDIVSVGRTEARIDFAAMTPQRQREFVVTSYVTASVMRSGLRADSAGFDYTGGGDDLEDVAGDRCYELLDALEEYVRAVDTTLEQTVRQCFCVGHIGDGVSDADVIARGRSLYVVAEFEARFRIQSTS